MLPLTSREADIIDYLYKRTGRAPYAMEIARDLKLPTRTVYRNLESLRQKEVVEVEEIGRMKLYKLSEKWRRVAEAVKTLVAETNEAITLPDQIKVLESLITQIDSMSLKTPTIGFELTGAKEILKKALQKARKSENEEN